MLHNIYGAELEVPALLIHTHQVLIPLTIFAQVIYLICFSLLLSELPFLQDSQLFPSMKLTEAIETLKTTSPLKPVFGICDRGMVMRG